MIRVLCVDDEPYILDICSIFLSREGDLQVDTAESAEIALKMHAEKPYDAIVSDYQMAGMDGIAFLKHLRRNGDNTPFIIFTGRGREEVAIEALNSGADFYIQKGGDPKAQFVELAHKIRHAATRRRAEMAAATSASEWERTFDAVPDMIALIDREFRIVRVNRAMASRLGRSQEALAGQRCYEVMHGAQSPPDFCLFKRHLNDGTAIGSGERVEFEDGRLGGVFELTMTGLMVNGGKTSGIVHIIRDITERKRVEKELERKHEELLKAHEQLVQYEEELRQSFEELKKNHQALQEREELYRTIFENTGTATSLLEEDTTISLVNTEFERLAGLPRGEVEGKRSWTEFVAREDVERMLEQHRLRRKEPGKALRNYEFRFVRADGEEREVYLTIDLIPGTRRSVASILDLTEQRRAARELERKHEELLKAHEQLAQYEEELRQSFEELKKNERALQERERSLMNLVRALPDLVIRTDREGVMRFISASIRDYFEVSPADCVGRRIQELGLPPDLVSTFASGVQRVTGGGESFESYVTTEWGGQLRFYNCRIFAERDAGGMIAGALVLCRDITTQRMTELNYRLLFEKMMDAFVIHEIILDDGGTPVDYRFIAVNPSFERITGLKAEEVIGRRVKEVIPDVEQEWIDRYGRVALTGVPEHFVSYSKALQKCFEVTAFRTTPHRFACTFRDVTASMRASRALQESEEFNRRLVENLPDYIVVCGYDGVIHYVNPAVERAINMPAHQIVGKNVFQFIPREFHETSMERIKARLRGESIPPYEMDIYSPEGQKRNIIVKGVPLQFHQKRAILLLINDITDQKRLEMEMKEKAEELKRISNAMEVTNRKLNLLSSITRHEIANQLQIMNGYLEILAGMTTDSAGSKILERVLNSARSINSIIQFTTLYERIGIREPTWHDLRWLVDAAAGEFDMKEVIVENMVPEGIEIFADPLVSRVFFDLVENSLRHGVKVSRIRFGVEEHGTELVIFCEDDGMGVPQSQKEKIFERGFGKHTGLGLFLARETLAITGMKIRETGREGEGARFEILVPEGMFRRRV